MKPSPEASVAVTPERALEVHRRAIVVDGHADTISRSLDQGEDLGVETGKGHIDLPRMARGGLDAQFFACFVEPKYVERGESAKRAFRMIDAIKRWIAGYPGRIELARTSADVRRAAAAGKLCGILCIEGGHAIEDDLALLRAYHELGVRYMTLTWNNTNNWADAARGEERHGGLSPFGREVVREMNRIGMLVDLSHVSEKTFYAAVDAADTPVICSHSCARALCDHPRNMTDDQLRALARNGGVVGVNFYSGFLSQRYADERKPLDEAEDRERAAARARFGGDPAAMDREFEALDAKYQALGAAMARPAMDVVVDHVAHMADVAGIDHVGLGSDFDGVSSLPGGMDDCAALPALTQRLLERGFPEGDVVKILGENFLRVMDRSIDARAAR